MSRQAIAAVLARTDLASGERLVALSLASFAGRENRAWPGAPAASARAGLSRSRYQQAREQFVARGLVAVDERATGRGRASTVTLLFADTGPWWDGEINVELFEAVLAYSRARGPERLLLATMAAVADEGGEVRDLSTEQLCAAAGIADRTYRRARTRCWRRASSSSSAASAAAGTRTSGSCAIRASPATRSQPVPRRVAPPAGARPLVASALAAPRLWLRSRRQRPRKGRPGSDTYRGKQSDPDRGFRAKGRSRSDSFGREVSSRDRGFGSKGRSGSDTFRAGAARNPGTNPGENPGRNPGSQRARGKGTPEPQNQGRPPQPP